MQDLGLALRQIESLAIGLKSRESGVISAKYLSNLSSGETSLLNCILVTLLRDFDLCNATFAPASDISGIVVVDEIDLHLHAIHQHEVLPKLMQMFPRVQFIVTTHSPLFVLGMNKLFGEDGFALYRLPQGHQISPEEFSEFGDAYRAFANTTKYSVEMRNAIDEAQKPILYSSRVLTDIDYIQRAAVLLGKEGTLEKIELKDGNGARTNLKGVWETYKAH